MAKQRVHEDPRMSVNSLAAYLVAPAARRQKIILEQKRPKSFQVAYYDEVEEAIVGRLSSPNQSTEALDAALSKLQLSSGLKDWELTRRSTGIEAIEAFRSTNIDTPLEGIDILQAPSRPRHMHVDGVAVSVRPELLLANTNGEKTKARLGVIKIYLSKKPLTEERARYTGTILYKHVEAQYSSLGTADHRLCFVLDVFAKRIFSAPQSYKRRQEDVEAACKEIALAWPLI
ncbi:MAG TPA: hypothetical protein VJ885_18365 [Thermoanaerobaculia bacterium]|jgi:hypothetical protein|nr:hypothetical protein [Thermoanaerobaculia bacterium]